MKTLVAVLTLLLTLCDRTSAQTWANLPAQQVAPTNGLGFLVHNPSGYARGYWSNFTASITASNGQQIASSNLLTAVQVATQVASSNFLSTLTLTASIDSIVTGQLKTNTTAKPFLLIAGVSVTAGTGAGTAALQARVLGFSTNTFGLTITGTGANPSANFGTMTFLVPVNAEYTITNTSTGTGNTSTLFKVSRLDF